MAHDHAWPELPLSAWSASCETLHRFTQVVGKVQLALTPLVNHWWNVTLLTTARGLTTPPLPYGGDCITLAFDFSEHRLTIASSRGAAHELRLTPMSVASFYADVMAGLEQLGVKVKIWTIQSEIVDASPFGLDRVNSSYDQVWIGRL